MAQSEISKPIHIILDGDNYSLWAQGMCSFFKGHELWLYVTRQRIPSKQHKDETEDAFALRLEYWDGVNYQIITWLCNTYAPSVSMKFGGYDTTKDVRDMLASGFIPPYAITKKLKCPAGPLIQWGLEFPPMTPGRSPDE